MGDNEEKELVGVKEIARRAKVSIATVDRAIHNRIGVSPKTKAKIYDIIAELDYQPNILARRLASRKVVQLAALIPSVSSETDYWEAPLNGIEMAETEIKSYGIKIDKYFFDLDDKRSFLKQSEKVLKSNPDGILLAPIFIEESRRFVADCGNIPCVFINSDIPKQNSLCYIGPELYSSGHLAANLVDMLVDEDDLILMVNISKEIDDHQYFLKKEEGFRSYFSSNGKKNKIIKIDIRKTDYDSIKDILSATLKEYPIRGIFVTNSRVFSVAHYLTDLKINDIVLVGFDFLKENIEYLKKGSIDFLICQKPQEQGYRGIMALYNHVVLGASVESVYYMPIDIITKENYSFYRN